MSHISGVGHGSSAHTQRVQSEAARPAPRGEAGNHEAAESTAVEAKEHGKAGKLDVTA